jgi:hypothetical protein
MHQGVTTRGGGGSWGGRAYPLHHYCRCLQAIMAAFEVFTPTNCATAVCCCCCRGLTIPEFPLLLLTVGEYIAARRGLGGFSKADALAGKRAEVSRAQCWAAALTRHSLSWSRAMPAKV